MYSPKYAVQDDPAENELIISNNPFATIVYSEYGILQSFHLPMLLEGKTLYGHMALANSAWKALDGTCALFIFHGPHHYISPNYYGTQGNVPTWNYISVQVRGKVSIRRDQAFLKKAILDLNQKHDPGFDIEKNISQNIKLLEGIVGIEVHIQEMFGKFKLAQSKSEEERKNVIANLENLATAIKRTLKD